MLDPVATVKRWVIQPPMPLEVRQRLAAYHPVLAQVLFNRGQDTPAKAQRFLEGSADALHNPFHMHDMPKAVHRIRHAIKNREEIAIYGDFDADGVTSTALLTQALEALGGRVQPYIPNRVDEGYGLNKEALLHLKNAQVSLVVTVDCGIRAVEEVDYANKIGLDVIVTDHHSIGDELPRALAVVDPKIDARLRLEEGRTNGYPEDMLAGVGVAYKLADALFRAEESNKSRLAHGRSGFRLEDLLDLVAIGTVADLAPLDRLENRELVRRGLDVLNGAKRPGLYELMEVANVKPTKVTTTTIGFMLGPRINAAGRLDSAMIAYDLLMAEMPHATALAQELHRLNQERQSRTLEAVEKARARALAGVDGDIPLIFDSDPEFLSGIVGLVAGRLCEEFYRPAVVIEKGDGESRGSCRSIPEFDITRALDECAELLVRHGGHAQAAGFTVLNENLDLLRERLTHLAGEGLRGRDLRPTLLIDAEVPFEDLTMDLARLLERLEPTGAKNGTPVLVTRNLRIVEARRVGQDGRHLRLRLAGSTGQIDGIGFKLGPLMDELAPVVDVTYYLEINEWNGHIKLQMNVQDIRPAGQALT